MLTWGVLKNVSQVVQRVVFLHEDLMKLPSFPRKALEAELDLYANGEMGKASSFLLFFISYAGKVGWSKRPLIRYARKGGGWGIN